MSETVATNGRPPAERVADLRQRGSAELADQVLAAALQDRGLAMLDIEPGQENGVMAACRRDAKPIALIVKTGSNGSGDEGSPRWLAFYPPRNGTRESVIGGEALKPVPMEAVDIRPGDVDGLLRACNELEGPEGCLQCALVLFPQREGFRLGYLDVEALRSADTEAAALIEVV